MWIWDSTKLSDNSYHGPHFVANFVSLQYYTSLQHEELKDTHSQTSAKETPKEEAPNEELLQQWQASLMNPCV